jgi:hypothetical protein
MRSRWAWVSLAGVAALVAVTVVLALTFSSIPWPDNADAVFVLAGLAPAVVGAVLAVRRPENAVGKLLSVIGAAWLLGEASRAYMWMSLHTSLPATGVASWLVAWLFAPAWMLIPILLAVYPSGRVASSWLRVPVRVYFTLVGVMAAWGMVSPASLEPYGGYLSGFSNPLRVDALAAFEASSLGAVVDVSSISAVVTLALLAIVDLIRRWRGSRGVERLQIRTFALSALVMVLLFMMGAVMAALDAPPTIENLTTTVALSVPSIAIGVAILRYRLYEIDRLISRTVSYVVVAGLLAAVFASVAIGLPRLVGVPGESPVLVAGATLAVAALFNPLRRRVQARVDRRFNRARYDAQREVDQFAERLRDEVELRDLNDDLIGVVSKTLMPSGVALWVRSER